jgi:hypothetical protein
VTGGGPFQATPDPTAALHDARVEVEQLQRLHEELTAKASHANQEARRVRLPAQALERKGEKPTQQQAEALVKHAEAAKARNEVEVST